MESSQQNLEEISEELQVIKCVVVGDTGVGKTRLICARACGTKYSLPQLSQTHVPTVWAIDQYRKNPLALQRSWCMVDNVNVSLRLWDTFGDHNKDRRFAYGRADVILVCFSVIQPRSLQHVWNHWLPEIQRSCPRVPIVLCGCQVDLRYLYKDPYFLNLDKGPFFKEILDDHILLPEAGRSVSKQICASYYETSVLEQFGIDTLFVNVARAALVYKRESHFWNNFGILKAVSKPVSQPPHLPPQPIEPEVTIESERVTSDDDLVELLSNETFCDVVFVVQKVAIAAHKVCLFAATSIFDGLFFPDARTAADEVDQFPRQLSSDRDDCAGATNVAMSVETLNDTAQLIRGDESLSEMSCCLDGDNPDASFNDSSGRDRSHDQLPTNEMFTLIRSLANERKSPDASPMMFMVDSSVSPAVFRCVLRFLYTGKLVAPSDLLRDVHRTCQSLGLLDVVCAVNNVINNEEFFNQEILTRFQLQRRQKMINLILSDGLLSDVEFKVDDGRVKAHRVLLAAGCDVMASMFSNNFVEAVAKMVSYPGITAETFRVLQCFLYTGECPDLTNINRIELIELANRLCLPRLVAFAEQSVVRELTAAEKSSQDIAEEVLTMLEPAQLHNAVQLAEWCLWYLSVNYIDIYKRHCKVLHMLRPENQIYLTNHKHPPTWFLTERDLYERSVIDFQRERTLKRHSNRQSIDDCGCLCFSARRSQYDEKREP